MILPNEHQPVLWKNLKTFSIVNLWLGSDFFDFVDWGLCWQGVGSTFPLNTWGVDSPVGDPVVSMWQGHLTLKQVLQGQAGREGQGFSH